MPIDKINFLIVVLISIIKCSVLVCIQTSREGVASHRMMRFHSCLSELLKNICMKLYPVLHRNRSNAFSEEVGGNKVVGRQEISVRVW